jgi:DNA-directed RNA polymerase subunit F|tara:strand:- start:3708 stop:3998 length:291 start_codon:yes stop_codon:yes gene_type:complete
MVEHINMMNWLFKKTTKDLSNDDLDTIELKVISKYIHNQKAIIEQLSERNMQLTAEIEVLREVVDELSSINNMSIDKAVKTRNAKRQASAFRKVNN